MSISKLSDLADHMDTMSDAEKKSACKMAIDSLTPGEIASYLVLNWGSAAALKVSRNIEDTVAKNEA